MANETQADPRKNFTPRFLPWLLAAAAFAAYWLTLNHWVGLSPWSVVSLNPPVYLDSLLVTAKTAGWVWQPEFYQPVFLTVTYPLRCLPAAQIPVALNLFSAVCAALTLGLLARSVAILPHDRTEAQRKREHNDFSFLTTWSAWLPPVFAAVICGFQLTFLEQATNCTGEMFHLLIFAFAVWSLLEYRVDERAGRLFLAAAVYGAGMTDDWALIGFLPFFVGAIIWIRGLSFFNSSFLVRMILCGLAGLSFYLLLPLAAVVSHKVEIGFWQALRFNVSGEWSVVKIFFTVPAVRWKVSLLSLLSLMPVLVLAIRWRSSFGDNSKVGQALTNFMFHLVHAVMLFGCVWVAFDPPFSPRNASFGLSFLTFYFLGALSVGYYSGYFLLVFGKAVSGRSRRKKSTPIDFLGRLVAGAVCLFAAFAMTGLVYKNIPQIRDTNDDTFKKYAALTVENLPRAGGILLSDDARRQFFVQAALTQDGRAKDFVLVDTASLPAPGYHHFLHEKFPDKWPDTISAAEKTNGISPLHLISLLALLAKTNELYYLHPSFGYYFEQFCMEPRGLVYKLNTLPEDTLLPPLPDKNQIAANETFWAQAQKTAFDPIIRSLMPRDPNAPRSFGEKLLDRFQVAREPNPNAVVAGSFYSRSLDFWGVQLQRAGELEKAAASFEMASNLNPDNVVAQINLQFNQSLRAGRATPVDLARATTDKFGKYNSWDAVLGENGPFDETSFCFKNGAILMQGGLTRQAVAPFERVRQLAPDNLPARIWLAQAYLADRLPDRILDVLQAPLAHPETFSTDATNLAQIDIFAAGAYFQKNNDARGVQLVEAGISRQPTNDALQMVAAQIYIRRGLWTNALAIIDRRLQAAPDEPAWLFGKGLVSTQMKAYDAAIAAFTHLLSIQTNNNDALFNRAVASLQSDRLDAARADYEKLQQIFTNSPPVAYGLGEIAWRKHETNEAVRNYEIYLAHANPNTTEATNITERLNSLKR
jgi:tetratricopeptide (TPR) repeat protein